MAIYYHLYNPSSLSLQPFYWRKLDSEILLQYLNHFLTISQVLNYLLCKSNLNFYFLKKHSFMLKNKITEANVLLLASTNRRLLYVLVITEAPTQSIPYEDTKTQGFCIKMLIRNPPIVLFF